MSNRLALYRPAFFFEQHRPLICNMLCSSITRRSHSHARIRSVCLSLSCTFCLHTHSPRLFSLCRQKTLKYVACPQNFGSFCCIFSYAIENSLLLFPLSFFFVLFSTAQTSQTDILIGTFGTVSILCWKDRQVSGCWGRGPGWLVCSEACLNQLAAWIARLSLTGIHWDPWHFLKQDSFFARSLG